MAKFQLSRRAVLRGAGGIAVALPWLEIMRPSEAQAQATTAAKRFIAIYQPGGTVLNKWLPGGTETAPVLSPILTPFEAVKSKLLMFQGLDMKSAVGEQHQAGIIALLTGTAQVTPNTKYASGPSIDQVIATKIAADLKAAGKPAMKHKSLTTAIRWATGKSHGLLHPINALNFADSPGFAPIAPSLDPKVVWDTLFKGVGASGADPAVAAATARKKSVLDYLDKRYLALSQKLGGNDKMRLDEHLTKVREIENSLTAVTSTGAGCVAPTLVDTADYNPTSGRSSANDGSIKDTSTDAAIPKVGKLMMDMIVMALACEITPVATLQWSDTEAKHTFPWLSLPNHHHYYQHDGGFNAPACEKIATWYSEQHAYLLKAMSGVMMGENKTLLDESVVLIGSELQEPSTHKKNNLPLLIAGGGGGLRGGRFLKYSALSHNNLLVSILNLFGDSRTTFGGAQYCTGPLTNLK